MSYGLYAPTEKEERSLVRQCGDLSAVLPRGGAIAHLTAARLYGLWLPRLPSWVPTMVSLPPGQIRPERKGMYVFRSRAAQPPPRQVAGVDVVTPAVCLGQLAEDLRLIDLVVAIDGALHLGLCTVGDIIDSLRSRQRGLPMLRGALNLCDGRSESPWESILRLLLVTSGIAVNVQPVIRDDFGKFIARADLRIKGTRRLPEYDGASHRLQERHEADLEREKALARAGWERFGYIAREILEEPAQIVRDAEIALGLDADSQRLATWLTLVVESSLTFDGRLRLARRLHRFARPLRGRSPAPPRDCGK